MVNYICQLEPNSNIIVEDDNTSIDEIKNLSIDRIIISPGPGHEKYDTGTVIPIIKEFYSKIPILGICLGHQAIVEAFGEDPDKEYVGRAKFYSKEIKEKFIP